MCHACAHRPCATEASWVAADRGGLATRDQVGWLVEQLHKLAHRRTIQQGWLRLCTKVSVLAGAVHIIRAIPVATRGWRRRLDCDPGAELLHGRGISSPRQPD
jgi:hypothetical protein